VALAGLAINLIDSGKLDGGEGRDEFLGIFPIRQGFGLDDFAKGAVVIGLAAFGGAMVHKMTGLPQGVKV